jgi:hypothetical protein
MPIRRLTPAALLAPALLGAQSPRCGRPGTPACPAAPARAPAPAGWRTQAGYAVGNAALGGLTAAVASGVRAHSWRAAGAAFASGALGGAGIYLGKRTAAQRFDGAGLAGRQLAAVGASVVRDAGAGRPPLSRLVLPLGPVRVYVGDAAPASAPASSRGPRRVRVRLDAATVVGAIEAARQPGARFDLRGSLSAGALAFVSRSPAPAAATDLRQGSDRALRLGWALGGALWVLDQPPAGGALTGVDLAAAARTRAHEQVHLVQYDAGYTMWALDGERRLFASAGRTGRQVGRWLDLGLHIVALGAANGFIPYERRPWEREAHALAGSGDSH